MAVFTPRFLRHLRDVLIGTPADGEVLTYDTADSKWKPAAGGGAGSATLIGLTDVTGTAGTGKAPVSDGAGGFPLTDVATQTEFDALLDPDEVTIEEFGDTIRVKSGGVSADMISADSTTLVGTGTDVQAVLEELDNAIVAADPAQSVILAPATSARNTIAPPANTLAFRIISTDGADASKNMIEAYRSGSISGANFVFDIDAGGGSAWNLKDPIAKFEIDLATGKTTDGFVVYSGNLDQFSGFDKRARLFTQITTAPADADVDTGEIVFWYDKTNGAAKWMAKGKTADGTVVTWEIPSGVIGLKSALDDHLADTVDAHDASAISFTPTGTVAATDVQAAIAEVASEAGGISATLFDANTVLKADSDDTPVALTMGASTILARLAAGGIVAATPAELRTLLALVIGTNVEAWDADLDAIAALAPSAGDMLVRDATAWTNTPKKNGRMPTGAIAETIVRCDTYINNTAVLFSQRLSLVAVDLPKGVSIASITFMSGTTTAMTAGVNQLFGLYDSSRNLLRGSLDDTNVAWGVNQAKTLALTSAFVTTYAGLHYLGILVNATTVPGLIGTASAFTGPLALAPLLTGSSSTGVTALPNPAGAMAAVPLTPYAYCS